MFLCQYSFTNEDFWRNTNKSYYNLQRYFILRWVTDNNISRLLISKPLLLFHKVCILTLTFYNTYT